MFERLRRVVFKRRLAYRAVFRLGEPATNIVMSDLRKFCRATSTPAIVSMVSQRVDPMATGIAIGRLEVWHRIAQHLHLDDSDLYKLVEQVESDGTE